MRFTLLYILSFILSFSQSFAGLPPTTIKGQNVSGTAPTTFNFQVPFFQSTRINSTTALIETGSLNTIANPGFEDGTASNWSGGLLSVVSSGQPFGLKALSLSTFAGTYTNDKVAYNADYAPGVDWTGLNIEAGFFVNIPFTGYSVCAYRYSTLSVLESSSCLSITARSGWQYVYATVGGGDNTKRYQISLVKNGTIVGPAEVTMLDEVYIGYPKSIGSGTPPNEFSAYILANGTISSQTPSGWITSTSISDTSLFQLNLGLGLSSAMDCVASIVGTPSTSTASASTGSSNTLVNVRTWSGNAYSAQPFRVKCNKTGSDFVQSAITPNNWNREGTKYTPSIGGLGSGSVTAVSGTYSLVDDKMFLNFSALKDGTAGTGGAAPSFSLPAGYEIDTGKHNSNTTAYLNQVGSATINGTTYTLNFLPGTSLTNLYLGTSGSVVTANAAFGGFAWVYIKGRSNSGNAPQLLGSVTSNAPSAAQDEEAHVGGAGGYNAYCGSSPCTLYGDYTGWLTNVTRASAGTYTANFSTPFKNTNYTCGINVVNWNGAITLTTACYQTSKTTSSLSFGCSSGSGVNDVAFLIRCRGAR